MRPKVGFNPFLPPKSARFSLLVGYNIYRKLPLIGPGLIQVRKGLGGLINGGGLYPDGLISGRKKRFEMSNGTVDRRMT